MSASIRNRFMEKGEEAISCSLVEKAFNEFVVPDYEKEGIVQFFKFANPLAISKRAGYGQTVIVTKQKSDLVGIIEMQNYEHIAMLFVSLELYLYQCHAAHS